MLLFRLFENNPVLIIPWLCALLFAITIHEFFHGFTAYKLGDDTAERMGRLTLNPIAHLDLFGSLMLFLVGFGWAKPVPVDIYRLKKGNLGLFIVSSAGIIANLICAVLFIVLLKFFLGAGYSEANLLIKFLAFLIYINLSLFIFNLIPVYPLDGYNILESISPKFFLKFAEFMRHWGFFILFFIVFMTDILGYLVGLFIYLFSILFNIPIVYLAFGGL